MFSICALSSVGRAANLHFDGREFKSLRAHKKHLNFKIADTSVMPFGYIIRILPV